MASGSRSSRRSADGSPPPAGAPRWMMNVGGGNRYALGDYDPANETWTTRTASSVTAVFDASITTRLTYGVGPCQSQKHGWRIDSAEH